jgi:hypothetical protein
MKVQLSRIFTVAAIGFCAACVSAIPASAQNINGSFTVSHEIRWQNATLPAGHYTFYRQSTARRSALIVTGPNGSVFELASVVSERKADGPSVLILERRDGTFFVSELDLTGMGLQLEYNVPNVPRNEKELAQGPASTEQILVAMAKN